MNPFRFLLNPILSALRTSEACALQHLTFMERRIMSKIDDLNTAVTRIGGDVTTVAGELRAQATALSNIAPDDSDAIEAAVSKLNASADTLEQASTSLTTATTTTTDPTPAPAAA